jgi:DNA-binding CsgD family transcriptional regulator
MKTFPIHPAVPVRWLPSQKNKLSFNSSTPLYDYLTKREIEIIRLLSEEHDSEEVAGMLCISRNTVDTHRKNIMKKLNTRSVVGIVRFAFKNGLIKI